MEFKFLFFKFQVLDNSCVYILKMCESITHFCSPT